ncbi:MAG: phosphoglycerate kinase, partial [Chlamydiae bacterium RIFCSPLOWO2_01_FULL_28_7]
MDKLTLKDIDLKNKKVLVRVDFNVPLNEDLSISDDTRIKASLDTINYLLKNNCSIILMSHLGRPKGKKDKNLSLKNAAKRLSILLKHEVKFADDAIGKDTENFKKNLKPKEILLLENLRFHPEEEKPKDDNKFAEELAKGCDIYVNDAFGSSHRKHSSIFQITNFFKNRAIEGFLLEKEVDFLYKAIQDPKRPFYAIIGGKKISTKIGVLNSLSEIVDAIFIGGAMSSTFFKAMGIDVASSLVEDDFLDEAKKVLEKFKIKKVPIYLPIDVLLAKDIKEETETKIVESDKTFLKNYQAVDIGPKTISDWEKKLKLAKTIFWNGPLGIFEIDKFSLGTNKIAKIISDIDAVKIVGGGDSVAAINKLHLEKKFTHLSTGGGASLEFIEFK